jgi:hypothetical protein
MIVTHVIQVVTVLTDGAGIAVTLNTATMRGKLGQSTTPQLVLAMLFYFVGLCCAFAFGLGLGTGL